jgi:uncharacterized protein with PhoU and TrkA domain
MILATRNSEGTFDTSPSASDRIRAGDTLIVLGTREQISRLERLMRGEGVSEDWQPLSRSTKLAVVSKVLAIRIGG